MKIAVFILLGHITCEVNKRDEEIKTESARKSDTLVLPGKIEKPVGTAQLGHVKIKDSNEPLCNLDQPEDVVTTDAVESPDDTRQSRNVETKFQRQNRVRKLLREGIKYNNTKCKAIIYELDWIIDGGKHTTIASTEQPGNIETTDYLEPTYEFTQLEYEDTKQPKNLETTLPEDLKITCHVNANTTAAAANTTFTVYEITTAEPATHTTKKPEIQANDTGPATIKVNYALKLLEKSKNNQSIALMKRLERLKSAYNVTELVIDHKIDVHEFDKISNTETRSNSSKILRSNTDYVYRYLRNVILNISSRQNVTNLINTVL